MVLYYSATGNTEYIAKELANALGDSCLNLLEKIKRGDLSPLHSETPFVICAPVIVCEMPRFLHKFLKELPLCGNQNVYFIFTSGGYSGAAGVLAGTLVKKKKCGISDTPTLLCHAITLQATRFRCFPRRMPRNGSWRRAKALRP